MSAPVSRPLYLGGTPTSSGSVQTEELLFSQGGGRATCIFSGVPGDVFVYSGAGRVNSVVMHTQMVSGQSTFIYDSAVGTSGGPFGSSGQKMIYATPTTWGGASSGVYNQYVAGSIVVDMPFQSGLVINSRSGCPGLTISWTPEISPAFPNA